MSGYETATAAACWKRLETCVMQKNGCLSHSSCDSPAIGDRWPGRKTRLLEGLGWPARNASESHGGGEKRRGTCQFVSHYAVGKTGSGVHRGGLGVGGVGTTGGPLRGKATA